MIDINELRRLAQAATPGPWEATTVVTSVGVCHKVGPFPGKTTEHPPRHACLYVDYESADNPADLEIYTNASFIAAANPAAITELLDRLEAAEKELAELRSSMKFRTSLIGRTEAERDALRADKATLQQMTCSLKDRLEVAENENAKLRIALAEKVTSEATLRDLSFGNGFIKATFEGGAVQLMVDALADQFVESGAANYIEMQFHSNVTGPLVATLQRVNGKTPHQLRAEAEQERDALRVRIEEMEKQGPVRLVTPTAYRWRYRGAVKWQYGELTEETVRQAKEHNHEVQPLGILLGGQAMR